ncbi:unnamed protein product [Lactuca saligna]|uniref:Uncharacterized protein n=1 Tax=Lactuca saligna TaxID=75948 RepID=A0AA36A3B6_LACSI|nr:unnamed protein product [Lactuca saligna]
MKPQYETCSATKITAVKVTGLFETESFPNANFKVSRGSSIQVYKFTLTNLPCLNSYDWIVLYNLSLRDGQKYEPVIAHLKQMIFHTFMSMRRWMLKLMPCYEGSQVYFLKIILLVLTR